MSRAALRRQAGASAERLAVVWGRAQGANGADAVDSTLAEPPVTATAASTLALSQPAAVVAPTIAARDLAPSQPDAVTSSAPAAAVPLSRRARRAQATLRPVADAPSWRPDLAPVDRASADHAPTPEPRAAGTVLAAEPEPCEPAEPVVEAEPAAVDEFEEAARLLSFTGEMTVQAAATDDAAEESTAQTSPVHVASRRGRTNRGASFRRIATASFSVGVFGIVGLVAIGMTTPAQAVAAAVGGADTSFSAVAASGTSGALDADELQAYVAPSTIQAETLDRTENYGTVTMTELASEAGIRNFSNLFTNDPNSNIQWPFSVGVTMSYGFGMRDGTLHEGIDFTPGEGSPVQAIADGTVRIATESGGAYGVTVLIDHIVDGQLVSSRYAHMLYGSLKVVQGQKVTVGTVIGNTGNTGRSFGAHTHFEILQNGTTAIDPWPWLQEHTDGTHTVG